MDSMIGPGSFFRRSLLQDDEAPVTSLPSTPTCSTGTPKWVGGVLSLLFLVIGVLAAVIFFLCKKMRGKADKHIEAVNNLITSLITKIFATDDDKTKKVMKERAHELIETL